MATATVDGIETHFEIVGDGPPVLMFSPGGFGATLDNWSTLGSYRDLHIVDRLSERYSCVVFDRWGSGRSGGRLERTTWVDYAAQGKGLLDHLGIEQAHLMGGCVGCSIAAVFALTYPGMAQSMVLFKPAGGVRYRLKQHRRFARHLAYVDEHGPAAVVALARGHDEGFSKDPRVGPWVTLLRRDDAFAERYAEQDPDRYRHLVTGLVRLMFDRDTVPGPEPEDLLLLDVPTLIVPGRDTSHATSAARFLEECLPQADYWDVTPEEQTADTVPPRLLGFLDGVNATSQQ